MQDSLYTDRLLEHWRAPQNYGLRDGFDAEARASNPRCGDSLTFRLRCEGDAVADCCFEHEGCVLSRASASLLSEDIKGRPLAEVRSLPPTHALGLLGVPITPGRLACALLPLEAIRQAV